MASICPLSLRERARVRGKSRTAWLLLPLIRPSATFSHGEKGEAEDKRNHERVNQEPFHERKDRSHIGIPPPLVRGTRLSPPLGIGAGPRLDRSLFCAPFFPGAGGDRHAVPGRLPGKKGAQNRDR